MGVERGISGHLSCCLFVVSACFSGLSSRFFGLGFTRNPMTYRFVGIIPSLKGRTYNTLGYCEEL